MPYLAFFLILATAPPAPASSAAADAVAAGVDAETVQLIVERAGDRDVSPLLQRLAEIARDDLPTEPMSDKVLEGLAKEVPIEAIDDAVLAMQQRFVAAAEIARRFYEEPEVYPPLLDAIEEALRDGVHRRTIRQCLSSRTLRMNRSTALAAESISAVDTLHLHGVRGPDAAMIVTRGLGDGLGGSELRNLATVTGVLVQLNGVDVLDAERIAREGIAQGLDPEAVLEGLRDNSKTDRIPRKPRIPPEE